MENAINRMTQKNLLNNHSIGCKQSLFSNKKFKFCPASKCTKLPLRIVPLMYNGNIILPCTKFNNTHIELLHNINENEKIDKVDKNGTFLKNRNRLSLYLVKRLTLF